MSSLLLRDYSKLSQVSLLKTKDAAHTNILNSIARLETMCGAQQQCVQTAGSLWAMLWTRCTRSVASRGADGPVLFSSNGVAERLNRTLQDVCALCSLTQGLTRTQILGGLRWIKPSTSNRTIAAVRLRYAVGKLHGCEARCQSAGIWGEGIRACARSGARSLGHTSREVSCWVTHGVAPATKV
jgi:hypothetical protein